MIPQRPPSNTLFPYTTLFRSTYNWEGVNPDGYFLDKLEPIPSALPSGLTQIGRAVQQECRDRARMPSSACKKRPLPGAAGTRRQRGGGDQVRAGDELRETKYV